MDLATKVNIVLSILSFILALISIVTVVITLLQNRKMIENATRPYVCVYGESINSGSPEFYIVIKNFGASPATITDFKITPSVADCYHSKSSRDYLSDLARATIAPGQSRICAMDYTKMPSTVTFNMEYRSGKKVYRERSIVDLKAGTAMLTTKVATNDKELRTISYTLQEMLQKQL